MGGAGWSACADLSLTSGRRFVFDIETDGLLDSLTKIHSLVLRDVDITDLTISCTNRSERYHTIETGLDTLRDADVLYGHNILLYDIPAIQKIYPRWKPKGRIMDTLITARMRWAHIKDTDFALFRKGKLPPKLIGSHSLKAWGYRMGIHKGDYGEQEGAWESWSEEMQKYCEQDTAVTLALVKRIRKVGVSKEAVETEHALALYLRDQEAGGFPFDVQAAEKLQAKLAAEREAVRVRLVDEFGSWQVSAGEFTPKRDNKARGYKAGVPVEKFKTLTFNPASRDHIASRLKAMYGWKPTQFNEGDGKPTVDDDILKALPYPPAKDLARFFLLNKRLGSLSEGKEAWLKLARKNDTTGLYHMHGRVNQGGAITHRASHSKPNMTQVPKVTSEYGSEMRALFAAGLVKGWTQMGADASGLELRCLAHYMAKYDGGTYGKIVLESDIHTYHREALGELVSQDAKGRDTTKTWAYATLYGAGDEKRGSILAPTASPTKQKKIGKHSLHIFSKNIPAFGYLLEAVKMSVAKHGYVKLIDGRLAYTRSEHSALNTLLQGTGGVICKRWVVRFDELMRVEFGEPGWNQQWSPLVWAHDEIQVAVRKEHGKAVGETAVSSIRDMTDHFSFRIPLDGEYKLGPSWAATH